MSLLDAPTRGIAIDPSNRISMTWPQHLRRQCVFNGEAIKLSPQQHAVLTSMLVRRGQPVPVRDLIEILYPDPDREPENPERIIMMMICYLRRAMPGLIRTVGWHGYQIDLPHDEQAQRLAA